jgi:hypothetical protein
MSSPTVLTMLLGIVAVPCSVHIHVPVASSIPPSASIVAVPRSVHIHVPTVSSIPPSAGIVAVPCYVDIHVPITSSVPPSADGLPKYNYAQKNEYCSNTYSSNFDKSLKARHCSTGTVRTA